MSSRFGRGLGGEERAAAAAAKLFQVVNRGAKGRPGDNMNQGRRIRQLVEPALVTEQTGITDSVLVVGHVGVRGPRIVFDATAAMSFAFAGRVRLARRRLFGRGGRRGGPRGRPWREQG